MCTKHSLRKYFCNRKTQYVKDLLFSWLWSLTAKLAHVISSLNKINCEKIKQIDSQLMVEQTFLQLISCFKSSENFPLSLFLTVTGKVIKIFMNKLIFIGFLLQLHHLGLIYAYLKFEVFCRNMLYFEVHVSYFFFLFVLKSNTIQHRHALGVVPWESENGHNVLTVISS